MSNDFKLSRNEALNLIKKNLKNGDILVFHDSIQAGKTVVDLLTDVLKYCRDHKIQIKAIGD